MIGRLWAKLRPAILWDFRRGSLQYDLVVILILSFVFLTPKAWFNDRPSEAAFREIQKPDGETRVFWIDPGALDRADPEGAKPRLQQLLTEQAGQDLRIVRTEPARDQAGNVRAYLVYAR